MKNLDGVTHVPWLSRINDPHTSKQAALLTKDFSASHFEAILRALEAGPAGVDGIAFRSKLTAHAVGKRVKELQRAGLIQLAGREESGMSGRMQRVWEKCLSAKPPHGTWAPDYL